MPAHTGLRGMQCLGGSGDVQVGVNDFAEQLEVA